VFDICRQLSAVQTLTQGDAHESLERAKCYSFCGEQCLHGVTHVHGMQMMSLREKSLLVSLQHVQVEMVTLGS
jgi:hypothetical protein